MRATAQWALEKLDACAVSRRRRQIPPLARISNSAGMIEVKPLPSSRIKIGKLFSLAAFAFSGGKYPAHFVTRLAWIRSELPQSFYYFITSRDSRDVLNFCFPFPAYVLLLKLTFYIKKSDFKSKHAAHRKISKHSFPFFRKKSFFTAKHFAKNYLQKSLLKITKIKRQLNLANQRYQV